MACLLVGEPVDDGIAELEVFIRRDLVQIVDAHGRLDALATAFNLDGDDLADMVIEDRGQRHELGNEFAVDAYQDIARCQYLGRRRARNHLLDGKHASLFREQLARERLGFLGDAQATQFVKGLAAECRLQRASRDFFTVLQFPQGTLDAIERQKEAARGRIVGAGIQRDNLAFDVNDGRAR